MDSNRIPQREGREALLSICIPAFNRPHRLHKALESILQQADSCERDIEIVVSDDSSDDSCRKVALEMLGRLPGGGRYVHNPVRRGLVGNWNNAVRMATGRYVHVLHDDDYLVSGALSPMLSVLRSETLPNSVILFGVNVVDADGKTLRQQKSRHPRYLKPEDALRRLLSNSAFVRFPGIVIRRKLFTEVGYFDPSVEYVADIDMWIRLMTRYGLLYHPLVSTNYTVHEGAQTNKMFNEGVIDSLLKLFEKAECLDLLDSKTIDRCKASFFHQFILAGTYRSIRRHNWSVARNVYSLFSYCPLQDVRLSAKWVPIRIAFALLLRSPVTRAL